MKKVGKNMKLFYIILFGLLTNCNQGKLLAGDSVCVEVSDSGQAQAVVSGGGISIAIPLMKKLDGGSD